MTGRSRHHEPEPAQDGERPAPARPAPAPSLRDLGPEGVQALSSTAGNHAVTRMLAGRTLQRQGAGTAVAPDAGSAADGAGPSREQKLATFHEHVKAARWAEAVLEANNWSIGDIEREVARPSVDQHARVAMYMQCLIVMWKWPPHVPDAIRKADRQAAVEGRKQFLHLARTRAQWDRWAIALDGFESDADIVEMVGWLLPQELKGLREATEAAGSPARVRKPVSDRFRVLVPDEMQGMLGSQAAWYPSGGRVMHTPPPQTSDGGTPPAYGSTTTPTDFASWALYTVETPFPALSSSVTINCWEMIMLAAYRAGALSWSWIHRLYDANVPKKDWSGLLQQRLTPKGRTVYDRTKPQTPRPKASDIVFFNGADHVTLATGRLMNGKQEVYTFWPPPNIAAAPGVVDVVKTSTIEELAEYMERGKPTPTFVDFGPPPW